MHRLAKPNMSQSGCHLSCAPLRSSIIFSHFYLESIVSSFSVAVKLNMNDLRNQQQLTFFPSWLLLACDLSIHCRAEYSKMLPLESNQWDGILEGRKQEIKFAMTDSRNALQHIVDELDYPTASDLAQDLQESITGTKRKLMTHTADATRHPNQQLFPHNYSIQKPKIVDCIHKVRSGFVLLHHHSCSYLFQICSLHNRKAWQLKVQYMDAVAVSQGLQPILWQADSYSSCRSRTLSVAISHKHECLAFPKNSSCLQQIPFVLAKADFSWVFIVVADHFSYA